MDANKTAGEETRRQLHKNAILNKSWRQHPTRHQLYGHLPHITKTIQVRRTRHAEHCWRSRNELIRDVLLWTPTHGRVKAGRPARKYIQQPLRIRDVVLKTYLGRWTIGRSGERGSGISVLPGQYDDGIASVFVGIISVFWILFLTGSFSPIELFSHFFFIHCKIHNIWFINS